MVSLCKPLPVGNQFYAWGYNFFFEWESLFRSFQDAPPPAGVPAGRPGKAASVFPPSAYPLARLIIELYSISKSVYNVVSAGNIADKQFQMWG